MSFLLYGIFLGVLVLCVVLYAKRSLFSALTGLLSLLLALTGALLLTKTVAAPLENWVFAPVVERSAANDLADMYSAAHLSSGRDTVAQLPLGELAAEQPEAYLKLLEQYGVSPEEVLSAYQAVPVSYTVLTAIAGGLSGALSRSGAFVLLTVLFFIVFRLCCQRLEQNLPPVRRYHGFKRVVPGLIGVLAGLSVMWMLTAIVTWLVPVTAGRFLFLTPEVLERADLFWVLRFTDPFLLLSNVLW